MGVTTPAVAVLVVVVAASACVVRAQYCHKLYTHENSGDNVRQECVRVGHSSCRDVELMWGDEVSRAAAALLAVALRRDLRYSHVRLRRGPRDLCDLALHLRDDADVTPALINSGNYQRLAVALSAAWRARSPACGAARATCSASRGYECGPGGARLRVLGAGAAPPLRVHVRLGRRARARPLCARARRWAFYENATALGLCDFLGGSSSSGVATNATVYVPAGAEWSDLKRELTARVSGAQSRLQLVPLARGDLLRNVRAKVGVDSGSFLFLDWDIWADTNGTGVSRVEEPPCASAAELCEPELDSAVAVRVADVHILREYAPPLFDVIRQFTPERRALREVLETAAGRPETEIEEVACEWVMKNEPTFRSWVPEKRYDYTAVIIYCTRDPVFQQYKIIGRILQNEITNLTRGYGFAVELRSAHVDCSDSDALEAMIVALTKFFWFPRLIGCVAGGEGAASAALAAEKNEVPLVLYDVPPADGRAPAATGSVAHLALAVLRFCADHRWSRLAVLSEPTLLAKELVEALAGDASLVLRDVPLPSIIDNTAARKALVELQAVDARVFLVNAGASAAAVVLGAARDLGLAPAERYAWIAREWYSDSIADMTHYTISFWYRGAEDSPRDDGRTDLRKELRWQLGGGSWPPRTVPIFDATLTLVHGFKKLLERKHATRFDLRAKGMFRSFGETVVVEPVLTGVTQQLRYRGYVLASPLVYVDKWRRGERVRVATWRVEGDRIAILSAGAPAYELGCEPPSDGDSRCIVRFARSGDPFAPSCHDAAVAVCAAALALAPLAACAVWRAARRLLARRDLRLTERLLARRARAAAALAAHLVDRGALEIREELGSGRFGRVWLALLREPGRAARAVAAKALRDDAVPSEESEFLREACVLASLDHEHVVRFVGVCAVGGPPLVLMEHAFFGDLRHYMRARRHLAEGAGAEAVAGASRGLGAEEAAHVSAAALTRLAREAASALGYLALRGVVHRDVRASNCLVDARRALKLADFGMARETGAAGADGAAEYACRRRGLFPVLWMAPESLTRGVFSAASDVWGLGVLVLEIVTLGARPYGAWSPLRVLQFVAAGGRPTLPLDTTAQTRGLAMSCWRRTAEERPTAAEVVAYLASHPRALRPALRPTPLEPRPDSADRPLERADPTDSDSGFGETPIPDLEHRFFLE